MEDDSRRIGARSRQFVLWAAAHILAEETRRPEGETLSKVLKAFNDLKPKDSRGAQTISSTYEGLVQRARLFSRTLTGGLNIDNPEVIRMLVNLPTSTTSPPPEDEDDDEAPTSNPGSTEDLITELFAGTAGTPAASDEDYFFDDIPAAPLDEDVPTAEKPPSALAIKQMAALEAYSRYLIRNARIPLEPYTRPDLGVTFFPTGRFDAGGVDWNYNGQIAGEMIRDCSEDKLVFHRGAPLKAVLEFRDWQFTRRQNASGTIWVWAVTHEDGKAPRFWFNNGDDQVRFYYVMTPKGVTQTNKKPAAKGSKKFIKVDERHIVPLDLDR